MERELAQLNFHHLRYFWLVAREGSLTRTAKLLHVAQSAVSSQIRALEEQLGEDLFERSGRTLVLTETGELVMRYADDIFVTGHQLLEILKRGRRRTDPLHIGAVATLSRNFQESFLRPLFSDSSLRLRLVSDRFETLVDRLEQLEIDVVLSNQPATRVGALSSRLIASQPVSLVGRPERGPLRFPQDLAGVPLLVPPPDSGIRSAFDALCDQLGFQPLLRAEVDDMALLRLMTRDSDTVALMPSVVVRDEILSGTLRELGVVPGLFERFYAITAKRRHGHPLLDELLERESTDILEMQGYSSNHSRR